jgi:hypothetical protein
VSKLKCLNCKKELNDQNRTYCNDYCRDNYYKKERQRLKKEKEENTDIPILIKEIKFKTKEIATLRKKIAEIRKTLI